MLFWFGNGFREVKGCGKGCEWCREVGNGGWTSGVAADGRRRGMVAAAERELGLWWLRQKGLG